MAVNEVANSAGKDNHNANRKNNGNDHNDHMLRKSDSRKYRVKREDNIQQDYLHYYPRHICLSTSRRFDGIIFPFHFMIYFTRTLCDKEQTTKDQNKITAADRKFFLKDPSVRDSEQRLFKFHYPGYCKKQKNSYNHR